MNTPCRYPAAPLGVAVIGLAALLGGPQPAAAQNDFQLNTLTMDAQSGQQLGTTSNQGDMNAFFQAQKRLVYHVMNQIGVPPESLPPEVRANLDKPLTTNFQAFTAFSQGLDAVDQGQFGTAKELFATAAGLDPNFGLARSMMAQMPRINLQRPSQEAKKEAKAAKEEAKKEAKAAKEEAKKEAKAAKEEAKKEAKAAKGEAKQEAKAAKEEAKQQGGQGQGQGGQGQQPATMTAQQALQAVRTDAEQTGQQSTQNLLGGVNGQPPVGLTTGGALPPPPPPPQPVGPALPPPPPPEGGYENKVIDVVEQDDENRGLTSESAYYTQSSATNSSMGMTFVSFFIKPSGDNDVVLNPYFTTTPLPDTNRSTVYQASGDGYAAVWSEGSGSNATTTLFGMKEGNSGAENRNLSSTITETGANVGTDGRWEKFTVSPEPVLGGTTYQIPGGYGYTLDMYSPGGMSAADSTYNTRMAQIQGRNMNWTSSGATALVQGMIYNYSSGYSTSAEEINRNQSVSATVDFTNNTISGLTIAGASTSYSFSLTQKSGNTLPLSTASGLTGGTFSSDISNFDAKLGWTSPTMNANAAYVAGGFGGYDAQLLGGNFALYWSETYCESPCSTSTLAAWGIWGLSGATLESKYLTTSSYPDSDNSLPSGVGSGVTTAQVVDYVSFYGRANGEISPNPYFLNSNGQSTGEKASLFMGYQQVGGGGYFNTYTDGGTDYLVSLKEGTTGMESRALDIPLPSASSTTTLTANSEYLGTWDTTTAPSFTGYMGNTAYTIDVPGGKVYSVTVAKTDPADLSTLASNNTVYNYSASDPSWVQGTIHFQPQGSSGSGTSDTISSGSMTATVNFGTNTVSNLNIQGAGSTFGVQLNSGSNTATLAGDGSFMFNNNLATAEVFKAGERSTVYTSGMTEYVSGAVAGSNTNNEARAVMGNFAGQGSGSYNNESGTFSTFGTYTGIR